MIRFVSEALFTFEMTSFHTSSSAEMRQFSLLFPLR